MRGLFEDSETVSETEIEGEELLELIANKLGVKIVNNDCDSRTVEKKKSETDCIDRLLFKEGA